MKFLIRQNCEYSLVVEARTEELALKIASKTPLTEWETAWSDSEAEDYDTTTSD